MTTTKYDLAYGRQGGRVVPFVPAAPDPVCDICQEPVVSGMPRHSGCEPEPDQLDLFSPEQPCESFTADVGGAHPWCSNCGWQQSNHDPDRTVRGG